MVSLNKIIEVFVGIALGLGCFTKFRFSGYIGPSEVFILFATVLLILKYKLDILKFRFDFLGCVKFILFVSIIFVSPLVTFIMYKNIEKNIFSPFYYTSFVLNLLFFFSLYLAFKRNYLYISNIIIFASFIYIIVNLISFTLPNSLILSKAGRFEGFANNPNQLAFYGIGLLFLLSILSKYKYFFILSTLILIVLFFVKSDAAFFSLFVGIYIFTFLKILDKLKLTFYMKMYTFFSIHFIIILLLFFTNFKNIVQDIWYSADEGSASTGGRIALFKNSLEVIIESPFIGLGLGNFSGFFSPFEGREAHNTFLDLSMQFGLPLVISVYALFVTYMFHLLKLKKYLSLSLLISFIIFGFFHFYARHFIFWFILAILYYSLDRNKFIDR